ncbi:1-deoxy-D-xylulose-5-phosphate synthase [Lactobacillus acetotolerans]|uniref:1-deoxy-D-xylulose-5-phosphate synthase n=2 Tax=Lactobacillus acetotolerans TaxID=1600 RepID=UPI0012E8ACDF|nr:1-deoxy-D-xylulose-5-phosphate synthase [Lactobacillus acetotolerans]QGV04702.1 1-deoxy-D-xylulose-5-phosphate synthase [Lactobacillus acetotolerans]
MNKHPDYLLNKISGPKDLKKLSIPEMEKLAKEIRTLILEKDAAKGGHLGPDLGIVEATIAYHYVFEAPKDKIVWDVSHQTYPHKMLTGRAQAWLDPDHYDDVTPYTNPNESPYDYFAIGHTSTSVALATGMAKARGLMGGHENITALIGDGSMTGGLAYEGLNNAAIEKHNLVIVVNDNQWSIDKNVGGLVTALKKLRDSNGETEENPFKAMGFDYRYVADGNNIQDMINAFKAVKDVDHPILLHINTIKGKGYKPAIEDEEAHHWVMPFNLKDDKPTISMPKGPTANSVAIAVIKDQINAGIKIMAINAAIPGVFDLDEIKDKYPDHYKDVGIAEQESVAFATGFAKEGGTPVLFENSSFLQRAFDQLSHDTAANDLPLVMMVAGGGISNQSKTHLGIFDQVMISNLPNWIYLAPTNLAEEKAMMQWAIKQRKHPVAIKMPTINVTEGNDSKIIKDYSNIQYQVKPGKDVAIIALGDFYQLGAKVASKLNATLVNPVSANILDKDTLDKLAADHKIIITLEDNAIDGGLGEKIASYLGNKNVKVLNYGQKRVYTDQTPVKEIYKQNHLTVDQIIADIKAL